VTEDAGYITDDLDVEERIGEGGGFMHAVAGVGTVDDDLRVGTLGLPLAVLRLILPSHDRPRTSYSCRA